MILILASLFLTLKVLFIYQYFLKFLFQQTVPLTRVSADGGKLHGTLSLIGPQGKPEPQATELGPDPTTLVPKYVPNTFFRQSQLETRLTIIRKLLRTRWVSLIKANRTLLHINKVESNNCFNPRTYTQIHTPHCGTDGGWMQYFKTILTSPTMVAILTAILDFTKNQKSA